MTSVDSSKEFIIVSFSLDRAGLVWYPEIGDEVTDRESSEKVSILVDPQGLTTSELRENFVWLPTVEQIVTQIEARQGLIYHAGINQVLEYETILRTTGRVIETKAETLRLSFAKALKELLTHNSSDKLH